MTCFMFVGYLCRVLLGSICLSFCMLVICQCILEFFILLKTEKIYARGIMV